MAATPYPSNRISEQREPKTRSTPVAKGVVREASLAKRVQEAFISTETGSIGNYVLFDIVIPAIKNVVGDVIGESVNRLFYGDGAPRRTAPGRASYTSYGRVVKKHDGSTRDRRYDISRRARSQHDFEEVTFETRVEASTVLDSLLNLIDQYGSATVQDLYDLCGISTEPVDTTWGWTALGSATVTRIRDGYVLDLPRPIPLDS